MNPDPHHFGNLDPHQSNKLDPEPDPNQFADEKPKFLESGPILALFKRFQVLSLYLKARIWIQIRIRAKSHIRIRTKFKSQNPDPHQGDKYRRIRIRINVMRIHNTSFVSTYLCGTTLTFFVYLSVHIFDDGGQISQLTDRHFTRISRTIHCSQPLSERQHVRRRLKG